MTNDLALLLHRLALLRTSLLAVGVMFLGYLQWHGFQHLAPAWWLLFGYLPLLVLSFWQSSRPVADWMVLLHLAAESQLLAGILFFTGGATNPFISYFLVLLVVAAYALPWRYSAWIGVICIIDYSVLTQWYLPLLVHDHTLHSNTLFDWHLAGMWLMFVISALIVLIFIPLLLQSQQRQRTEIQALREQQLKNEQLIGIATLAAGTAHEMGTPLMTMHMVLDDVAHQENHVIDKRDLHILREQVTLCRQSLQQLTLAGRQAHIVGEREAYPWLCALLHRWRLSHPNALWVDDGIDCKGLIPSSPLLDQALLNLLDNAAEAGQQPIHLEARIVNNHWQLDITQPDPMAGSHIQASPLFTSPKESGMGIGLYLSNASVEQFHGSVELKALHTGASLCRIRIPLVGKHKE